MKREDVRATSPWVRVQIPLHHGIYPCSARQLTTQKPKDYVDETGINRFKQFDEVALPSDLSIVGFIYEVLTNLQSNKRDLLFSFSSFEWLGRCRIHI